MGETRAQVCVVGSLNMDLVVRVPRLPGAGETLIGESFATFPGGKGANQAVAAARAGAGVSMVGCVGDDDYGSVLRGVLESEGVDVSRVLVKSGTTGVAQIAVDDSGENTIVVAPGANAELSADDITAARDAIFVADVLLMQLETPIPTVLAAAELAQELGTTVALNAAPAAILPIELLAAINVLMVNEHEAAIVAKSASLDDDHRLDALALTGIETVIATLGSRGAEFMHVKEKGAARAYQVEVVDTVGAGDAFAGVFAARLAEHRAGGGLDAMGVLDAVCFGCAAGALATTAHGAIASLPTRDAIKRLLKEAQA